MKSKIDKILRKCIRVCNCDDDGQWHIDEEDWGWATEEIMKLMCPYMEGKQCISHCKLEAPRELKVSYDEWRRAVDRIRELKSIIKQARASCFSNKPHKTIIGILDKGI